MKGIGEDTAEQIVDACLRASMIDPAAFRRKGNVTDFRDNVLAIFDGYCVTQLGQKPEEAARGMPAAMVVEFVSSVRKTIGALRDGRRPSFGAWAYLEDNELFLMSVMPMKMRRWRGYLRNPPGADKRFDLHTIAQEEDGSYSAFTLPMGAVDGEYKCLLDLKIRPVQPCLGTEAARGLFWSVLLGEGLGPRLRLFTSISGARDAFRLRDIPPGRSRRAALRHWVREHQRNVSDDTEADRIWVSEHMRGATEFSWNGLRCRIEPSEFDLARLKAH